MTHASTHRSLPELLALSGAGLCVLAAFLPWIRAVAPTAPVSTDGFLLGIDGLGAVTLLLGLVAVGGILLVDWWERGTVLAATVGTGVVLVAAGRLSGVGGAAVADLGLYLTLFAGFVVLTAAVWGHAESRDAHSLGR